MRAVVDAEKCIGCGLCVQIAPDIYQMDGDIAVSIVNNISEKQLEDAENAAAQCPVEAITVA
ncbi:MAG: ferredoxin [Candidatus Omnitrophota bacterium]